MADDAKSLPEEVAELTEAVRELRDREVAGELAALKAEVAKFTAERAAHGCHCWHPVWQWQPTAPGIGYPSVYTVSSTDTSGCTLSTDTFGAAGGGTTTYMLSNGN